MAMMTINQLYKLILDLAPTSWTTLVGSSLLPYIHQARDIDIATWVTSKEEYNQLYLYRKQHFTEFRSQYDWKVVEYPINLSEKQLIFYQYHFLPPNNLNFPNIYDPNIKTLILEKIYYTLTCPGHKPEWKSNYHIYTNLAMWRNGDYKLTDEDIEIINRLHDRQGTEEDTKLMWQMLKEEEKKWPL